MGHVDYGAGLETYTGPLRPKVSDFTVRPVNSLPDKLRQFGVFQLNNYHCVLSSIVDFHESDECFSILQTNMFSLLYCNCVGFSLT